MKIVIAPDSFKGSLSAAEVADAVEAGLRTVWPDEEYVKIPMADGGEGTVRSLTDATGGVLHEVEVCAPLGDKVKAVFGVSGDGKTAVIEMAAASGLHLVPSEKRNPMLTGSYGTGELIAAALDLGVDKIILGIGGSATNDGGAGMLQALGAVLTDKNGMPIACGGAALSELADIDLNGLDGRLKNVHIEVACDVGNPLCGHNGASAVFGPQKGATPDMVARLDAALSNFAAVVRRDTGLEIADTPGSGAAGGMGAGLQLLPNVVLKSGVQIVIEAVRLAEQVKDADWVITGEGRMDAQSIQGKTPVGVARAAKQFGKLVIALVGSLGDDYAVVYEHGIDAVFPIIRTAGGLETALRQAEANLQSAAGNIARLLDMKLSK
ncbi:glycerate kinase [Neisseria weaveri]|uniref:glycerate kinase n=1 Tax=Neisseria weaveri TaxID=28091 RepID=UPI000D312593|nr:glycerate kinase [Neisseria weaveri]